MMPAAGGPRVSFVIALVLAGCSGEPDLVSPGPLPPAAASAPAAPAPAMPAAAPADDDDDGPPLDSFRASHRPANGEGWYTSVLDRGQRRAISEGKPLLLIFEKPDCRHCRDFNRDYLADPEFAAILEQPGVVVVKRFRTDLDREEFRIDRTPTFIGYRVRDGELEMTDYIRGLYEKDLMAKRLSDIASGNGRLTRLLAAFDEDPKDAQAVNSLVTQYLDVLPADMRLDIAAKTIANGLGSSQLLLRRVDMLVELWRDEDPAHGGLLAQLMAELGARAEPSPQDSLQLGHAWRRLGDYEQATSHLRRAAAGANQDCIVLVQLVHALARQAELRARIYRHATAMELLLEAHGILKQIETLCPKAPYVREEREWFDKRWNKLGLERQGAMRTFLDSVRESPPATVDASRQLASLTVALAATPRQPVLQIDLPAATRQRAWESAREFLAASNLVRAALAHCHVVFTERKDSASDSVIWLLHHPETLTARMGRFFQDSDGWFFIAESEAGVPGFRTRVSDPGRAPRGRPRIVRSPEGEPLVRGRIVARFTGWPDAEALAVTILRAEADTPILTELRSALDDGLHDADRLLLLLSDTHRPLLRPDEQLTALRRLLAAAPDAPTTARALLQTALATPEAVRELLFLERPREAYEDSPWHVLLTAGATAMERLEAAAATDDPALLTEVTRVYLALAARADLQQPQRREALLQAERAVGRLRELTPASPEIPPLDWAIRGLRE